MSYHLRLNSSLPKTHASTFKSFVLLCVFPSLDPHIDELDRRIADVLVA